MGILTMKFQALQYPRCCKIQIRCFLSWTKPNNKNKLEYKQFQWGFGWHNFVISAHLCFSNKKNYFDILNLKWNKLYLRHFVYQIMDVCILSEFIHKNYEQDGRNWKCNYVGNRCNSTNTHQSGMILRNHTYLKVYKCWRILPILKMPTIKWLTIFFKKYFNFQGFYIIYIIIWRFLGWKNFTPWKLREI